MLLTIDDKELSLQRPLVERNAVAQCTAIDNLQSANVIPDGNKTNLAAKPKQIAIPPVVDSASNTTEVAVNSTGLAWLNSGTKNVGQLICLVLFLL